MNTIAIYAGDYLILLELMSKLERELTLFDIRIFADDKLLSSLPVDICEQVYTDINEIKYSNIIILLKDLDRKYLKEYKGKILNMYGDSVEDPLMSYLYEIASVNDDMHITLSLPLAVYGKDGVDILMQQTRSVYSFEEYKSDVFPARVAFNVHFYNKSLPSDLFKREIDKLSQAASLSLRINPVSTVFIADLYCSDDIYFPKENIIETIDVDKDTISLDDVGTDGIIKRLSKGNFTTLVGDYLYIKTDFIIRELNKIIN